MIERMRLLHGNGFIIIISHHLSYNYNQMGFGSFVFEELRIANSCYMAAAIEFNWAIFYIFSGPLFANLEGYAFLDLLIWGVSPIIFQACRGPLKKHIQLSATGGWKQRRKIINRRFWWFIVCSLSIAISYVFMNYSPSFRWNYFSRIINLDFGYLLFDIACRCMELYKYKKMNSIKLSQRWRLIVSNQQFIQGYCKYKNIFMTISYFCVFYLSTVYDPNDFDSGIDIFNSISLLSCLFTLSIPLLYIFRHRHLNYGQLTQIEQQINPVEEDHIPQSNNDKQEIIFGLLSFSFFINTSYFSLWIMEGLKKDDDNQYQQFNKTLLISSAFFLVASFIEFVISNTYIGCRIRQGFNDSGIKLERCIRPFLIFYGVFILVMFIASRNMNWHYMAMPIILYGFHEIIVAYYSGKIAILKQRYQYRRSYRKILFYCEVTAFLIFPAILMVFGLDESATYIFGFLSGGALVLAGIYH